MYEILNRYGQVKTQLAVSAVFQCRSNSLWENQSWKR